MSELEALCGARIFDGERWHDDAALLFSGGRIVSIGSEADLPPEASVVDTGGGMIVPGFIDLQVNGGGGILLNDEPTVSGIARICAAHAAFGTTGLLPTLITDDFGKTAAAIEAGRQARARGVPGFLGLHLEGPHISMSRKGAHDGTLIRPMEEKDLDLLLSCGTTFDAMMVTIAPESVTTGQARRLAEAGLIVSLGHTDTDYETAKRYIEAGARTATHLFNAMSPLAHREPGLTGAALNTPSLHAGLIADGVHVHPAAIGIALRAKQGPGRIFIVTDAMSPIGTAMRSFRLNEREILRHEGRLTLADGTLAGADIDMISSVRFLHDRIGLPVEEAFRMASLYPAQAARLEHRKGRLGEGHDADFLLLGEGLDLRVTWIGGRRVYGRDDPDCEGKPRTTLRP